MVFANLDQSTWLKTLDDSRSAYTALREHFLLDPTQRDDLAAADPLADDIHVRVAGRGLGWRTSAAC